MEFLTFIGIIIFLIWVSSGNNEKEEIELSLPEFEIRKKVESIDDNSNEKGLVIECKGILPNIFSKTNIAFITSIFDITDSEESHPVLCHIDSFQEKDSIVFQTFSDFGEMDYLYGFKSWIKISLLPLRYLQAPRSGTRKLKIIIRMVDIHNSPIIEAGFKTGGPDALYNNHLLFTHNFLENGYLEEREITDDARNQTVRLAMSVAMSDGSLDKSEADLIKKWTRKRLGDYSDNNRTFMKDLFNQSMKDVFAQSKESLLDINPFIDKLNSYNEDSHKIKALDLCYQVMAADGIADPKEMKMLNTISEKLNLDRHTIESIRDKSLILLDSTTPTQSSAEEILGIKEDWDNADIRKHLTKEFQKWNNRITVLPEGEEKNNAQQMIDRISIARKKYE